MALGFSSAAEINLASGASVSASSSQPSYPAGSAIDGVVSDPSRWLPLESDQSSWIELSFPSPVDFEVIDLFSGWKKEVGLRDFDLTLEVAGKWVAPVEGRVRENGAPVLRLEIKGRGVSKLKLAVKQSERSNFAKIREIAIYANAEAMVTEGLKGPALPTPKVDRSIHQVALNQVGYRTSGPKRFTAPLSPDGSHFEIHAKDDSVILHRGVIEGGVGDFSAFRPNDPAARYVVEVRGGSLGDGKSGPFMIREDFYQAEFWQSAVDFLIDSRSVVGTHPSAYGGCPWRDGTHYDAIVPSLVIFYLADSKRVDAMPRQIDWEADKARVLSADFKFDAKTPGSEGVMDAVKNYYALEAPKSDAPDVVKMIHWGAGFYLVNPATKDPSGDPDGRRIHTQTVEQIAYVVWAWPTLKQWLPQSFYDKCRDFCFANWKKSLEVDRWWGATTYLKAADIVGKNPMGGLLHPYKGRHAPGHSIVPNLLMHEVAKREKRDDAEVYMNAAVQQTEWIIQNLDWNDPRTTKGQRMSEHRTIPNLVWFLQKYPDKAPRGLKEKITEWAKVAVKRSDNMWDFRRYDLENEWSIPKLNDVGNSLSLPAIATAASWVVDDPALKRRLEEIAVASVDHVFGRSPALAASAAHPENGFPEIERGWPKSHPANVCARLELCRATFCSSAGTEMYPFNPEGGLRHAEGWVNYGACWCISLAYLQFDVDVKTTPS